MRASQRENLPKDDAKKKGKSKRGASWKKVSPAPKKEKKESLVDKTKINRPAPEQFTAMANGPDEHPSASVDSGSKSNEPKTNNAVESEAPANVGSYEDVVLSQNSSSSSDDEDTELALAGGQDQNIYEGGNIFYASDNDPYIYSDDSESFSDAYFRPQQHDFPAVIYPGSSNSLSKLNDEPIGGRRFHLRGTEEEPLTPFAPHSYDSQVHQQNTPGQYGSVPFSDRSMSPFKISGSIKEDSPVDDEQQQLLYSDPSHQGLHYYSLPSNMPADEADAHYLKQAKRERRRLRKQQRAASRQRQMMMIHSQQKREQAIRERTVTEVKGRPQDERKCRDPFFAYLFLAQLLIVLICAAKSGTLVLFSNGATNWGKLARTNPSESAIATTGTTTTTAAPEASSSSTSSSSSSSIPSASSSSSSSSQSSSGSSSIPSTSGKSSSSSLGSSSTPTISGSSSRGSSRLLREQWLRTRHEDSYKKNSSIRRASSPMLDSSSSIAKNATLHDVLINDNDTEKLLSDDTVIPEQDSSSSSSSKKSEDTASKQDITQPSQSTPVWHPTSFTIDYQNAIALVGISGFYACILSYLSFGFMLIMSRALIQVTLVFSILLALAWGMLGLTINPYGVISIMGFGALLLTLGYTIYNWQRVPFSSTNLHTALCAMRCTGDLTLIGMVAILVAFAWCVLWSMAFIGVVDTYDPGQCTYQQICVFEVPLVRVGIYSFFLVSFYWTNTVIKNVLRVTVASTIGTWWYYPQEISPLCSAAVGQPLIRSLTKSLGSICLGSLVSQAIQVVFVLARLFCYIFRSECCHRSIQGRESVVSEVAKKDTLSAAASNGDIEEDSLPLSPPALSVTFPGEDQNSEPDKQFGHRIRCFNRWSYTYIGMYGYNFCEGGEKAIQLFEAREWMEVVRDNLIQNVLLMASIVIGGSTGSFAVLAEEVDGFDFTSFHKPITTAFLIGSVMGFVLSNILLLGVVGSAVNTILVCFAAGPFEFDRNHPRLSREMREVWMQQVWKPTA